MGKLKILFYGFRHYHIYTLYDLAAKHPDVEIVGHIEPNPAARAEAEAKLGVAFLDVSLQEALQGDVDAVAIGDAYGNRGKVVLQAMQAGKHILIDKPLCTSLAQLEQIEQLSAAKGLQVCCMLDLRYSPAVATAQEILQSGALGAVHNVSFNGQHCIDYAHRPHWYFEPGMHGGTINDLAIHGIDLVRMLTGQNFVRFDTARVWNAYATEHPHFKDCATFSARLQNGAQVMADTSYAAPCTSPALPFYWEFRFWCAKGVLTFSATNPNVFVYKSDGQQQTVAPKNAPTDFICEFMQAFSAGDRSLTQNTFDSTRTALQLQAVADQEA